MVDKITDFLVEHSFYQSSRDEIRDIVAKHMEYKTILAVQDNNNDIIVVSRWNQEGDTLYILDLTIHPSYRGSYRLIKMVIKYGLDMNPFAKHLKWERHIKYGVERPTKTHKVRS